MRLCIDAVPLLVRSAGVKNHLFYWIDHLRRLAGDRQVSLFPFLQQFGTLDHERSLRDPVSTYSRLMLLHFFNMPGNRSFDWVRPRVDVFHTCKLIHPPRYARLTATLHDMTCWLMPEVHRPEIVKAEKRFAELVLQKAHGLIAVSESTRNDAIRILGLDPEKIRVIYHGVPQEYLRVTSEQISAARIAYGLDHPYILFVGTIEPRKNIGALLDAYAALPPSFRAEYGLVIAGPLGWEEPALIHRLTSAPPGVRYLGYVPETGMPGLMAGATIFIYPSLYEGFGFPIVQAMAAGVPVVTSGISAMPEIAGGAAELVDPRSTEEIRAALERLLLSPSRRTDLSRRGRDRARHFRWETCAAESLEFFDQVAGAV